MKIQTFIEKAIEGGWRKDLTEKPLCTPEISYLVPEKEKVYGVWFRWGKKNERGELHSESREILMYEILLDPEAWKAVGKVEGWPEALERQEAWKTYMHRMIDALAEGGTISSYLETL